jgi:hypothetical protein
MDDATGSVWVSVKDAIESRERQLAALRSELLTAHGEAEERMRERDAARADLARKEWAEGKLSEARTELARKQRVIDEASRIYASSGRLDPDTSHRMHAAICHEVTPPAAASPVGCDPSDPLQVEWEADGFYITAMPEEWREKFEEMHGDIDVRSVVCPGWNNPYLWLRGDDRDADNDIVPVPESDRPRVMAAIASVNAKHRKSAPTVETVAEYMASGEPGRSESPYYGLIDAVRSLHAEVDCRIEHGATSGGHLEYVRCKLADMLRKADIREVDLTSPASNPPETPERSTEVPGANPAVTLAFKRSLDEASAIVAEWPAWKRDALKSVRETLESVPDEPVTNRAKVAESDGTKALRLVARLAECVEAVRDEFLTGTADATLRDSIRGIASEARGGGE